jgi:hypothetical protein
MAAPYTHIGGCVEDSEASRQALAEARRLRALGPGRLSVVHVAPSPVRCGDGPGPPVPEEIAIVASHWLGGLVSSIEGAEPVLLTCGNRLQPLCPARSLRPRGCRLGHPGAQGADERHRDGGIARGPVCLPRVCPNGFPCRL